MAADERGSSGIGGAAAGMVVGMVVMGALAYYWTRPNPLHHDVSEEEFQTLKKVEKKEERALLSDLEKKLGPDHPQVKQMKMELGDDQFPNSGPPK